MNTTIVCVQGRQLLVTKARLHDMMASDHPGNPMLWWSYERENGERYDYACGVKTRREAVQAAEEMTGHPWSKGL